MPQVNYTPIQLYRSGTAGNTPSAGLLQNGELAINYADGKLFYKDGAGTVRAVVTPDGSVTTAKIVDANVTTAKIADANVTPAKLSAGAPTWTSGGALTATGKLTVPTGTSVTDLGIQFGSSTTGLWSYDVVTGDGLKVVVNGVVQATFGDTFGYNDIGYSRAQTVAASSGNIVPTLDWVNSRMNLGSGSLSGYAARAWVNFNGTGTVAIRASGNVSSITDNAVGNYTVNFTTTLPDANYAVVGSIAGGAGTGAAGIGVIAEAMGVAGIPYAGTSYAGKSTTSVQILTSDNNNDSLIDAFSANVVIFR